MAVLSEYGLLKVHGADAAAFLQSQLTNDVAGLDPGEARLAGYCSVKGRLTASFWVWRDEPQQAYWLACSRDIAATVARRLSMFVLRAKARVEDMSEAMALVGSMVVSPGDPVDAAGLHPALRLPPVAIAGPVVAVLQASDAPVTDLQIARAIHPVVVSRLAQTLDRLRSAGVALLPPMAWRRLEVLSGIARIEASSQDLFVPQMVNFELVNGVSFSKGCYPGQEIVARSQYLGKLKRRMFLALGHGSVPRSGADVSVAPAHAAAAATATAPTATASPATASPAAMAATAAAAATAHVAAAAGSGSAAVTEPVGQVVLAAPLADHRRFLVLFESRTAAVAGESGVLANTGLRIDGAADGTTDGTPGGLADGTALLRLPLPYALPPAGQPDGR